MEIGLREWLIVIGIIVIAGILFDGWRRMRGSKGKLRFRLDKNYVGGPDDGDASEAEVLGPPRVVKGRHEPDVADADDDLPSFGAAEPAAEKNAKAERSGRRGDPRQGDLALDLNEQDPLLAADDDVEVGAFDSSPREQLPVEEVLIINVIARDADGFKGPALLQNILESGLRFGEMDIFHRHESMAGNGEVLFSMANGVKPGTFDLDDIELFSTRAVSFFLSLPGPRYPKQAFDVMVASARKLSQELDGELKDDQHSVLTAQTIEHYRQRIAEFERRGLTHKQR